MGQLSGNYICDPWLFCGVVGYRHDSGYCKEGHTEMNTVYPHKIISKLSLKTLDEIYVIYNDFFLSKRLEREKAEEERKNGLEEMEKERKREVE